ncbi:MAG: NAD(P)-dependent oxidoreductase [Dehalococcoidia bacterium]|nr:NAD(P)-dependent oxidoreductase [Dehalococcoidia bacterium]
MPDRNNVLITGSAGLIGGLLQDGLKDSYNVTGVDIRPVDGFTSLVADTSDLDAVLPAYENVDTVIDLASVPDQDSPWDVVYRNNLPSTYNALEAARRGGARRGVFFRSNHATGNYEDDEPYASIVAGRYEGLAPGNFPPVTVDMPVRPDGPYGIGKAFGEAAGRYYSDHFGLSVICLRIGTLNREGRPQVPRQFATLLSHRDLVQLVRRCIEAPDAVRFAVFYGVSNNTWHFWDISNSRELIGYEPEDDAEKWRTG